MNPDIKNLFSLIISLFPARWPFSQKTNITYPSRIARQSLVPLNWTGSIISLTVILLVWTGCAATNTQTYWCEEPSGGWISAQKTARVKVNSEPQGAEILVNRECCGHTPQHLSLNYELQSRNRKRILYKTTRSLSYFDCFFEGLTLGCVLARPSEKRVAIDQEVVKEYHAKPKEYEVSFIKSGYITNKKTIVVPRDESRTITVQLVPKEEFSIYPVQILQGVELKVPPLRWLRDHLFFPKGLSKNQYKSFSREVAGLLQSRFAESIYFLNVSVLDLEDEPSQGASLHIEIHLYTDSMSLRGQMRSARVFGSRVITREVQISNQDFPDQISSVCNDLADQLMHAYLAALNRE